MKALISSRSALILIVIAQFLGTSLWFAGNAVAPEISSLLQNSDILASITSAVQLGFIVGTLLFAIFSIPDRFAPADVFFFSSILAACFNLLIPLLPLSLGTVLVCRFMVGFFLAGIYPVGMKIAADYFEKGLGTALGFLVGALVLGTGFPHLLKALDLNFSWKLVLWTTSGLAILGGAMLGFYVPSGPFQKRNSKFDIRLIPKLLRIPALKSAASGYFGHMWELYTVWAFVPVLIVYWREKTSLEASDSLLAFAVIAIGGISCALGGIFSRRYGSRAIASVSLMGSGLCCVLLVFFGQFPEWAWISLVLIWGMLLTADSPQFSSLVAQSVPAEFRGTALTLVNSIGFAISIVSIQLGQLLLNWFPVDQMLASLVIGPLLGVFFFQRFYRAFQ
ncbi:MFS transporter [Algoriphagus halophytocola]|uniref:MFS transporter n=1 Tax=Algoriphagus halophytocola TaxID=2991499 RepID=A0ABY6MKY3_9BACT|nr:MULTISPECIES: MFS transporter [unclassified Algoriphagus]UZD23770.1 MFS transporter [Algoriphagus sp. TR-M5]WBL45064.1 MFS transporter [Algoriphagus sp. TR-M9]